MKTPAVTLFDHFFKIASEHPSELVASRTHSAAVSAGRVSVAIDFLRMTVRVRMGDGEDAHFAYYGVGLTLLEWVQLRYRIAALRQVCKWLYGDRFHVRSTDLHRLEVEALDMAKIIGTKMV